jgi:hypothetical protein
MNKKAEGFYLGDGAYVKWDALTGELVIFTHNGFHPTNSVFLGPNEIEALKQFLAKVQP